jgi:hypothetical protein
MQINRHIRGSLTVETRTSYFIVCDSAADAEIGGKNYDFPMYFNGYCEGRTVSLRLMLPLAEFEIRNTRNRSACVTI